MEEYDRRQREREKLAREADERCDRAEAEAKEKANASRLRNQRDVNERARMIAEREKKRVEEGFYDPHRLSKMQEDRRRRQQLERDKQAAARHEAESVARYLAAQEERDEARRMQDERNERLRKERMQRLIEMETDDEIERMAAKDLEDRRRWEADRFWRNMRLAYKTVTSKWSAYLTTAVFVVAFVLASIEVDTVQHRPVVRKHDYGVVNVDDMEQQQRKHAAGAASSGSLEVESSGLGGGGGGEGNIDGGEGRGEGEGEGDGEGGADRVVEDVEDGGVTEGGEGAGGYISSPEHGPGPWRTKYRWVSPTRAAGKLLPSFITSGAASLYKKGGSLVTRRNIDPVAEGNGGDGGAEGGNYVHGFDIAEIEGLGLKVETREGKNYLDNALEPHLAVDDPKEVSVHQKLLMNLVNRGVPLSPPPRPPPPPPPSPPYPPGPGDDPNIKATLKYLRGTHASPLDFSENGEGRSANPVHAPVTRGMEAMLRAHAVLKDAAAAKGEGEEVALGGGGVGAGDGGGGAGSNNFTLNDGASRSGGLDSGKSLELLYDDGVDPTVAATRVDGIDQSEDPTDPFTAAKRDRKEAKKKERAKEEETKRLEMAKAAADAEELRTAVVDALTTTKETTGGTGPGGVPLRNGAGVKFNAGGSVTAAEKGSLELAVARTPVIVSGADANSVRRGKKKKKSRGLL